MSAAKHVSARAATLTVASGATYLSCFLILQSDVEIVVDYVGLH